MRSVCRATGARPAAGVRECVHQPLHLRGRGGRGRKKDWREPAVALVQGCPGVIASGEGANVFQGVHRVTSPLIDIIVEMQESRAIELTQELLANGSDPLRILDDCRVAVEIIGKRFETGDYFLPELVMAGEMLKQI